MLIQFEENDIKAAMLKHVQSQGIDIQGKDVDFRFIMGRKQKGLSCALEIKEDLNKIQETPVTLTSVPVVETEITEKVEAPVQEETEAKGEQASIFGE